MFFPNTNKTVKVFIGLFILSILFVSGAPNVVVAGGGNKIFLPVIVSSSNSSPIPSGSGNQFFVTENGSSKGNGSSSQPWDLQTALNQPGSVKAGDTIWIRGGTYSGTFISKLAGTSSDPITVRAYPGERVTLTNSKTAVLEIAGGYVHYWGLEITSSYSKRTESRSESTYGLRIRQDDPIKGLKFINMIVHDVQAQGFGWWQAAVDSEIYGCLFFFNGTTELDHGVYIHNVSGTKLISNSFIFDNASHGIHGYAESSDKGLTNITVDGNTLFNNGSIGYSTNKDAYGIFKRNILVGGGTKTINARIMNNTTYYPGSSGQSLNLGYSSGSSGSQITGNYFAGGGFELGGSESGLTMTGNMIYAPGGFTGFNTGSYSNNTYTKSKPTGEKIIVRLNQYDHAQAMITIYNWSKKNTVTINAASFSGMALKAGQQYELHNVQNYYGDVVTGTYDGQNLVVPMTGHSVAQPVGLSFKPASTFPEFGGFVLVAR